MQKKNRSGITRDEAITVLALYINGSRSGCFEMRDHAREIACMMRDSWNPMIRDTAAAAVQDDALLAVIVERAGDLREDVSM